MEKIFSAELLRMLGILGLGGFSLMAIMGGFISKILGSFRPYLKATIIYLLITAVCFGILGFVGEETFFYYPTRSFVGIQLLFVLLGILHLYFMPKYLLWSINEKAFGLKVLYSIIVTVFGYMFFIIVFKWMNKDGYHYMAGSAALFFIIPIFVYETFLKAVAMSPKIYTQWFYPINVEMQEPEEEKLKNMLVISFEFQKKINEQHFTNFRAKAPRDMEFGELFYYFINDYNDRHPNSKIEVADQSMEPYGWIFYKKPMWYTISTDYISTEKTFYANRIKENEVIVCRRSLNI
jgi:Type VI secretion system, TssN